MTVSVLTNRHVRQKRMDRFGQLASGFVHELSSPLIGVLGYASKLLEHPLEASVRAEIEKIRDEAERAARIVRNLLELSYRVALNKKLVNLNRLLEETLALRRHEWEVRRIRASVEFDPALPDTQADPDQLQQVLLNLLLNAEQAIASLRDYGSLCVGTHWDADAGKIWIEVTDDGAGIDPAILPRIFEPFFTTKPLGRGSGLGLSISEEIVRRHEGSLTVRSAPGCGATFTIELPVVGASAGEVTEPVQLTLPANGWGRLLVVDDEALVVELLSDILRRDGYEVMATTHPEEVLEMTQAGFDLLICDLAMPGLDGEALYGALEESGSPLAKQILFTTGDLLSPRTTEFLARTGAPFLPKPFRVEEVRQVVRHLLQNSRHNRCADQS